MKNIVVYFSILMLALVLVGCATEEKETQPVAVEESETMEKSEEVEEVETVEEPLAVEEKETAEETKESDETESVDEAQPEEMEDDSTFTLEQLTMYDGKGDNPAYIAVDGVVYDVTDVPAWSGGKHNGNFAGQDATEAIKKAPHGDSKLKGLEVVGSIVD